MDILNSIQSKLAAKAGHSPAPEVDKTVASTPEVEVRDGEHAASPNVVTPIERGDHAGSVLQHVPLDMETLADIWDEVYRAPNADSLSRSLKTFNIPAHVAAALVVAKRLLDTENPAPSRADRVIAAAHQMAQIDSQLLDRIEKHPNVLKHLLDEPSKKD